MIIFSKSVRTVLCVAAFTLLAISANAQNEVAIGSATTKSNAILWLNGNGSQGLILPTVSNKTSVSNPDKGMIVYDNSDNKVWYRNDNAWVEVGGAAGGGDNATLNLLLQGNQLQLRDGTTILNSFNIAAGTQANGSFLVFQGGSWQFGQLTDATGTGTAFQVTGLRGKSLATLPATSQALVYDPAANSGNGGWIFQSVTLPTLANGQILTGNSTTNSATTLAGDATLSGGTLTISNNAITTAKINANAVDATKLADNAVTQLKIADATITGADIANNTITANKLAQSAALNGQVLKWNGTNWVPADDDAGVGATPTLANGQILIGNGTTNSAAALTGDASLSGSTLTISNNAITTTKINANAVDATKLADNAVTTLKVADNAITSAKIVDATITGADIANSTITGAKIANTTITGTNVANTSLTADKLAQSAATSGQVLKWNGTNWAPADDDAGVGATPTLANGQILIGNGTTNSAAALTGDATISGGTITISNNAITTAKINANAVDATKLADNAVTTLKVADNAITSAKIVDATITGADIANTTITGTNIASTTITADKLAQSTATPGQVLKWNGTNWAPAADDAGAGATPTLANGQILIGDGTTNSASSLTGDATLSGGTITIANNAITSTKIADGTIAAADLAAGSVSGGTGGVIADASITNDDIAAAAAIAGTKITPAFGGQNISTTGTLSAGATTVSGLTIGTSLWPANAAGALTNNGTGTLTWAPSFTNPMTTAGDIIYGGVGGTATRLATGTGFLKGGATPSYSAVNLASGDVSGVLPIAQGGTGLSVFGGGLLYASGPTTIGDIGNGTSGQMLLMTGTSPSWQTMSGDATIGGTGVITVANNAITDVKVATGISGNKIIPSFGTQNISTTGNLTAGATTVSGLTIGTSLWPANAAGVLTNNGTGTLSWAASSGWNVTGNAGTVDGTNFIGTTDNVPLNFRVFNQRAGRIEVASATANSFYGYRSGNVNTGNFNTAIGYEAMLNNTTGRDNAAVGYRAMLNNTTGFENAALGRLALELNTTGIANTAIGSRALNKNTASENTAVGTEALFNNTTAGANTAVGVLSLAANTAGFNSALGAFSMQSNTTGTQNAALGYRALISNTTGSLNTAIGNSAGVTSIPANANTTGSQNTYLGYNSGPGTTTQLFNATAIGANAAVSQSNSLVLGGINGVNGATSSTNVGIGTTTPAQTLDVNGNTLLRGSFVGIGGATTAIGSAGLVLQDDNGAGGFGGMYINSNATGLPFYGYALGGASNTWTYLDGTTWKVWNAGDRLSVTSSGNVGIGTTTPSTRLHIAGGNLTVADGTQGTNRMLVSDANGTASWNGAPGVEFIEDGGGAAISTVSTTSNLNSITVTAPTAGYITVTASGSIFHNLSGTGGQLFRLKVSNTNNDVGETPGIQFIRNSAFPIGTGSNTYAFSVTKVFQVAAGGSFTYYFNVWHQIVNGTAFIDDYTLVAQFVPYRY
jgi:hypothetical protein